MTTTWLREIALFVLAAVRAFAIVLACGAMLHFILSGLGEI